ncbi:hypothetical protein [Helicobacter sp. 23-1045]
MNPNFSPSLAEGVRGWVDSTNHTKNAESIKTIIARRIKKAHAVIARFCVAKSWQSIRDILQRCVFLSFSREVEAQSEESFFRFCDFKIFTRDSANLIWIATKSPKVRLLAMTELIFLDGCFASLKLPRNDGVGVDSAKDNKNAESISNSQNLMRNLPAP